MRALGLELQQASFIRRGITFLHWPANRGKLLFNLVCFKQNFTADLTEVAFLSSHVKQVLFIVKGTCVRAATNFAAISRLF